MTKKKIVVVGCIALFIIVIYVSCSLFIAWLDEPLFPDIPERSSRDKVIVTSNGCCFWATDLTVSLLDTEENRTVIISVERLFFRNTYESQYIPDIDIPIKVVIDFTSHYGIIEDVSLMAGEFANTNDLLKEGLLFYFGDGDLIIRNGNSEKFFRAGAFRGDCYGGWFDAGGN